MIKLAVLITGSPRFVPQGAEWWFSNAMPNNFEIDYYGHCWNSHDEIGAKRYYNADNIIINEDYFKCWPFKDLSITEHHFNFDIYDSAKKEDTPLSRFLLWDKRRDHILSVSFASELLFKSKKIYDLVIVMRFDVIVKPKSLDKVLLSVLNFYNEATKFHKGHDKALFWNINNPNIFTPWVQIRQGLPVMQDYMFVCTYKDWVSYTGGNLYQRYHDLLNKDKYFLEVTNFVESTYHPHIFWAFLGLYSKANFLANDELGCVALRSFKQNIKNVSYEEIVNEHDTHFDNLCSQYIDLGKIQSDL